MSVAETELWSQGVPGQHPVAAAVVVFTDPNHVDGLWLMADDTCLAQGGTCAVKHVTTTVAKVSVASEQTSSVSTKVRMA